MLKTVAGVFKKCLSEFDRAARIKSDEFAVIFPDRNKKKTIEIVEGVRRSIAESLDASGGKLQIAVGISENPIDGVSAQELFVKAQDRAHTALKKGESSIEAFA
jgi:diguanylate cyclase (GGDEF)-like protein